MSLRKNQLGFSVVEAFIVLLIVGVITFLGYTIYDRQQNKAADSTSAQSSVAPDVKDAPEIKSTNDLDAASAVLDDAELDDSNDSAQLDSELSYF